MKEWSYQELASSSPYKSHFNSDSFELFRLHFPEKFTNSGGYRLIWKDRIGGQKSLFNRLGTNYTAYTFMVNETIKKMDIDVDPCTEEGYKSIIDFLKSDKEFFTSLLQGIGSILKEVDRRGSKHEDNADIAIKKIFGDVEIKTPAGLGEYKDTHLGVDKVVMWDGKEITIQVKGVYRIENLGNQYKIHLHHVRGYSVHYFLFFTQNKFFFFRNRGFKLEKDGYLAPDSSLIKIVNL